MDSPTTTTIQLGPVSVDFLVDADASGGSVTVFECVVPADARVSIPTATTGSRRRSTASTESARGRSTARSMRSAPGESVCIRRGQVHGFENRGNVDAKFLAIATPGVFGPAYFRDIAQVLAEAADGPPDLAALGEVMRRHGLTPARPVAT
jgi:hypothetical protein